MSFVRGGLQRFAFKKNVDRLLAEAHSKSGLAKTLTSRDLVVLGVAGIIGAGIFVLIGQGIAKAGVMVVPAFVVAAAICAVAGYAYAELAAAIPASGSAYAYIYTALGELPGWMVAWALILEYAVGAIAVAIGWRNNFLALWNQFVPKGPDGLGAFGSQITYGLTHSPLESVQLADGTVLHGILNLPSILIVLLCTLLLVRGAKESARFTTVLVAIKVAILLFAIVIGFLLFRAHNLADPLPHYNTLDGSGALVNYDTRGFLAGLRAVFAAAAIMFFAYIGFDSVSTTAEETKDPKRALPIGILGSLGITTLLYVLAALALVGDAHWTTFVGNSAQAQLARGEPFGYVFEQNRVMMVNGVSFGAILVRVGALIGTTSVLLVLILGGVRVFFNMSRDGLLPGWMHRVSSRGAPAATTLFYGAFTMAFAGLLTLGAAVDIVNIGTLFAFAMVILAVWVFRIRRPDIERPFRMPLWSVWTKEGRPLLPLLSILGIIGIAIMVASLDKFTILASVTWAGLGFIVYAFYGVRNSKEAAERHAAQAGAAPPPRPSLTVATRDD
ncbi:MAG: basic amino acid/polyamine antiporter, family [Thermoplasmata archaeon]|nr:basic amino acid/polyamine antiporter, family [Thermoplasmata archaeon]